VVILMLDVGLELNARPVIGKELMLHSVRVKVLVGGVAFGVVALD
jgi:hypothetical protein